MQEIFCIIFCVIFLYDLEIEPKRLYHSVRSGKSRISYNTVSLSVVKIP